MAEPNDVQLGDLVRDEVTGLEGIAYGITLWLHGCRRINVQPRAVKDGKPAEALSVDEPQVTVLKRGVLKPTSTQLGYEAPRARLRATGGPMRTTTQHETPRR